MALKLSVRDAVYHNLHANSHVFIDGRHGPGYNLRNIPFARRLRSAFASLKGAIS
jgi:hypothetical protein